VLLGIWIVNSVNSAHQPEGWWTYRIERWWIYLPTLGLAALALLALYQSAAARAGKSNPPPAC
jgi:H+/Cl- antiporter ClcA